MLKGKNIILRPLRFGDDALFFKWRNELDYIGLTKSFRFPKHQGLEKDWLENAMKDKSNKSVIFIIENVKDNVSVGFVQLNQIDWISRNCSFGIAVPEKIEQGRGFGKEAMRLIFDYAFNCLNLEKISLEVTGFNANSIHLYEKFGFEKEGVLKKQYFWKGEYHDVLIYGLLKENLVINESE